MTELTIDEEIHAFFVRQAWRNIACKRTVSKRRVRRIWGKTKAEYRKLYNRRVGE